MDKYMRQLARESASQYLGGITRFIREEEESQIPDETLLLELRALYLMMVYAAHSPRRTD